MTPDLDLQLQVVIKALRDTVFPALDPTHAAAAEQLSLSIATLTMARARLPDMPAREWIDLADAVMLGRRVVELAPEATLDGDLAEAATLLCAPCPPVGALGAVRRRILATVSKLANTAPDETADALMRVVIDESGRATDMARAWSKMAGFEPDPAQVPELGALIAERLETLANL
jgi:hypothetical protein